MNYGLTSSPSLTDNHCMVVGIFNNGKLPDFINNSPNCELLTRLASKLSAPGDIAMQSDVDGHSLLVIQCGALEKYTIKNLKQRLSEILALIGKQHLCSALICMPQLRDRAPTAQVQHMALYCEAQRYQLTDFKTKNITPRALESITFFLPRATADVIPTIAALNEGINLTRTLTNLPANICTPSYLALQAMMLAKQIPTIQANILAQEDIQRLNMGALLAVAQGSSQPPQLIELHYDGCSTKGSQPIILVGKGVTFDSGGISLKPPEMMHEMKYDMAGAASVFGTIKACALLKLPIHIIGLVPATENMPGGRAVKPGDIITSMAGLTVEITNTDAEGRLILADALHYAERFNPKFVLDIATLTGAIVVALGSISSGFMTTDEELAMLISDAAVSGDDKAWRMPLDEEYQAATESPLADMMNSTLERVAGSLTAASFLSRFTQNYRWAHLDIAGTAWISGAARQATGRPVPLLVELLRKLANAC